jgi:nucleotide-binding universal stress UspA family protein
MGTIRKILVPTDFSRHALEAFRQALTLARATGASVTVLHVARPPAVLVDGGRLSAGPKAGDSDDLWADLRKIKAEEPGVVVEHEVIVADRPDVAHILNIVESTGCDLIVMGTHGLTGLKHRLFGGLTEEVVRHARCPVMVVKAHDTEASSHREEAHARAPVAETKGAEATTGSRQPEPRRS